MSVSPKLQLLMDDKLASATLSSVPMALNNTSVDNIALASRGKVLRVMGTSLEITVEHVTNVFANGFGFGRHNLSTSATWNLELFSDAAATTKISETGQTSLEMNIPVGALRAGIDTVGDAYDVARQTPFWFADAAIEHRSAKITINDPLASMIEVGLMQLGLSFAPSTNQAWNWPLRIIDTSQSFRAIGGAVKTVEGIVYRELNLPFEWLNLGDIELLGRYMDVVGKSTPILVCTDPTAVGQLCDRQTVFAHIANDRDIINPHSGNYQQSLQLVEV